MWKFHNPVRIIGGENALQSLGDIIQGRTYAIVSYQGDLFAQYIQSVIDAANSKPVCVFPNVAENPSVEFLDGLCLKLSQLPQKPDFFIALGGGSVIDSTKVLAASKGSFKLVEKFIHGGKKDNKLTCTPIIALPTTAGTGSEVTCWASLWDMGRKEKYSLEHSSLYPDAAIYHTPFTAKSSRSLTVTVALDALSHAFESLWNKNRNPVSAGLAVNAARKIMEILPLLLDDLENMGLRARMQEASLTAGMAFSNTRTSIAHAISYSLTLEKSIPHGIACSFTLPAIMRSISTRDAELVLYLESVFSQKIKSAADTLETFLNRLGVSTTPVGYGYSHDQWDGVIKKAISGQRGQNFSGDLDSLLSQFKIN